MWFRPVHGLVLGGGGARGGAHIGVLHVLSGLGYNPDIVVGTSIGAVMAALLGLGWDINRLEEEITTLDYGSLFHLERSGGALLSTDHIREWLTQKFDGADLRDLSPQVAVMASDVRHRRRVLIDQGPVIQAVLASTAVPGLFPAVEWGDALLVDGGMSDNLPTQAAYQLGANRLIAVDVSGDLGLGLALGDVGSFSKQLERALYWLLSLSRRQQAFDTWVQASIYSNQMLADYQTSLFPPDVLIKPDLPNIGMLALDDIHSAIEAGRIAAQAQADRVIRLMRRRANRRHQPPEKLPPLLTIHNILQH